MSDLIPVSRLSEFIVKATLECYNAKARLMQGSIPIVTGEFTLELTGFLVDDHGGKGINEIEVIQKTLTPLIAEVSENASPVEITKTVVDPEVTTSKAVDSAMDDSTSEETTGTNDTSNDTSNESASESGTDRTNEQQTQAYGREVRTTNKES